MSGYNTALCSGPVREVEEVEDVFVQLKPNAGYERDYKNMCTKSSLPHKDTQSHNQARAALLASDLWEGLERSCL